MVYIPTSFAEIKWDKVDSSHLVNFFPITFKTRSNDSIRVNVDLEKKIIEYSIASLDESDSFDYLTEKGALRWLFKKIGLLEFCKNATIKIPLILEDTFSTVQYTLKELLKEALNILPENKECNEVIEELDKKDSSWVKLANISNMWPSVLSSMAVFMENKDDLFVDAIVNDLEKI